MSKRLAVVVAAAVAALGCIATASADTAPAPLSPDAASALVAGPGTAGVSDTTSVDASTALAAAASPDAVTSYESDLTLDQAVGLTSSDPLAASRASATSAAATVSAKIVCWTNAVWGRWGIWPYDQKVTDTTYWCGHFGGKVTYRTTTATAGGTFCGVSWRASGLISGGIGYPNFTVQSSAGFACPTDIPWITIHTSHHIDVMRDTRGVATIVGQG